MARHNTEAPLDAISGSEAEQDVALLHPSDFCVREALANQASADVPSTIPSSVSSTLAGKPSSEVIMLYLCPFLNGGSGGYASSISGNCAGIAGPGRLGNRGRTDRDVPDEQGEQVELVDSCAEEFHPAKLTATETRVMRLLAEGKSNRTIAGEMFISINTVKTHVRAIFQKLGVSTRGCAVTRAVVEGLIDLPGANRPKNHPFG